jgi:hypothetical protein
LPPASRGRHAESQAVHHHHPVYLMGGFEATATVGTYPRGLFLYDRTGTVPTLRPLCTVPYTTRPEAATQRHGLLEAVLEGPKLACAPFEHDWRH